MIVVADSGSTKCDWIISNGKEDLKTKTMGFNPFFHSTAEIANAIADNSTLCSKSEEIEAVYFYGAGCSSEDRNMIVKKALMNQFPNAETILVDHDLTAAALATCGDEPGIACILGTGSNSCYFDGQKVTEAVPALGYILGDEGSGSYFGKILLREFLYNRLPSDLQKEFGDEFGLTKERIFTEVYSNEIPNVYLASFMKFVSDRKEHPYMREMIYDGLAFFAYAHIMCFPGYRETPVHVVGSIGYYFQDILEEVADNYRFTLARVEKRPIQNLLTYHLNGATIKS